MTTQPKWIGGRPVPRRVVLVPAPPEDGSTANQLYELRWGALSLGRPEQAVDHDVFAAAVYMLTRGDETVATAILESLGYRVSLRSMVLNLPSGTGTELRRARRMVAMFWFFTVAYAVLIAALAVTVGGAFAAIFIAILVYSWVFHGWRDTKPHFTVLREARKARRRQESSAGD